jgi:hypothetical protein
MINMPSKKGEATKKPSPKKTAAASSKKAEEKKASGTSKKAPESAPKKPGAQTRKVSEPGGKKATASTKKAEPKARPARSKKHPLDPEKGDRLYCTVCGIVVTVDEECGCEACDIICCGEPMQAR